MKNKKEEITFKDILSIFLPKMWIIAIVSVVLAVVFAMYASLFTPDTYTATSRINVRKKTEPNIADIQVADSVIETFGYYMYSDDFCEKVAISIRASHGEYGAPYRTLTAGQVKSAISYAPMGNGNLTIQVTTTDQILTYQIAAYIQKNINGEIANFYTDVFHVDVIDTAKEHPALNPKSTTKYAVIGFAIGAIFSAAGVWLIAAISVSVRDKKKLTDNFDIPLIGVIPKYGANLGAGLNGEPRFPMLGADSDFKVREAYNNLATNLIYLPIDNKCKKIAVASSTYGEGKDSIAINTAISLSENLLDKNVLLIDADMRTAQIADFLGIPKDISSVNSLSDYLSGNSASYSLFDTALPNFKVVAAGAALANPAGLVRSDKMSKLLGSLEEKFDYIIINTPPVGYVSDAILMADRVDGFILSTRAKRSTVKNVARAEQLITSAGAKIYGMVFTDSKK